MKQQAPNPASVPAPTSAMPETIRIRSREMLSESWSRLEQVTFDQLRPDGSRQTLRREVYFNGPGSAVLPYDAARGTVLLVRQLRIPAYVNGDAPFLIELCAGLIEGDDSPLEAVCKEALQEMGYRLRNVREVFALYSSPGASAEKLYLFIADYGPGDHVGTGGGIVAEGEQIELLEMGLAEAWSLVEQGGIVDAKTVLMLQHIRLAQSARPVA